MKKLVILSIALLIAITLSTAFYFQILNTQEIKTETQTKSEVTIPQEKIIEVSSVEENDMIQQETKQEVNSNDNIKEIIPESSTNKNVENPEKTNVEANKAKEEVKNNKTQNVKETPVVKEDSKETESQVIATTCSMDDKTFIDNLNYFKSVNSSSRLFNTKEEAISFGEQATLYGYGYFYSNFPDVISGTNCNQTFYSLQLYIPAKLCGDNKMLYLPASVDLIDSVEYLEDIGYVC